MPEERLTRTVLYGQLHLGRHLNPTQLEVTAAQRSIWRQLHQQERRRNIIGDVKPEPHPHPQSAHTSVLFLAEHAVHGLDYIVT